MEPHTVIPNPLLSQLHEEAWKLYTDGQKAYERYSTPLIIREMQIKRTMRYPPHTCPNGCHQKAKPSRKWGGGKGWEARESFKRNGTYVYPSGLIHAEVWQKPTQHCKAIILQLKISKSVNNECWRRCGEKGTLLHCEWECKLGQPL